MSKHAGLREGRTVMLKSRLSKMEKSCDVLVSDLDNRSREGQALENRVRMLPGE